MDTPPYVQVVERVPSFWIDGEDGEVFIPFYVHDEVFPDDIEPDDLRDLVTAALEIWYAPLREAGRRVEVPLLWASSSAPPPERRVDVFFVWRGDGWLGVTRYNGTLVQVELSVRAQSTDRFLTRRELLAITIHEFGHALGISQPGHSQNPNDIMFGHDLESSWITLSNGDRETLLSLYPR